MLSTIFAALNRHLAKAGLPLYLEDCVPPASPFPYCTAGIALPLTPQAPGRLTLTCWCADNQAHTHRLHQAELLLAQLPGRGFHLDTPAGRLVARMDGNARLLRESAAQGIRIEWVLHFFPAETGGAP